MDELQTNIPDGAGSSITVGNLDPVRRSKKIYLILAAICLTIAVVAGLIIYQRALETRKAAEDIENFKTALEQHSIAMGRRQYADALVPLQEYVKSGRSDMQKAYAYANMGSVYEAQQKNIEAYEAYRAAEKIRGEKDYVLTVGLARTALAIDRKQEAIKYYKQTIELLKAKTKDRNNNSYYNNDLRMYEDLVKKLESQS